MIRKNNHTQIWTPRHIVESMLDSVTRLKPTWKYLDACSGEGVFAKVLIERGVPQQNITGVEIDPKLIELCKSIYPKANWVCGDILKHTGVYDVVFSNPPYQEQSEAQKENENNTSVAQPIYHKIVEYTIDELKPKYVCMITPSRWMAGGKGLDSYRERMLNDKRFRSIQDFPGAYDIFTSVKIDMGVSYFVWDRDYNDQCEFNGIKRDIGEFDILVRNNTSHQIVKKVLSKHNSHFCNERVFSTKPFGLPSNFSNWSDSVQDSVKCICRNRVEKQVICGAFTDEHGIQSKWKVCTPAAYGEDTSEGSSVYNIKGSFLLAPGTICTETYIVIGVFITEKEANAYLFYANTKFYRFMVGLRKSSQRITKDKFAWVPDFGNYSKVWTDTELYQYFGLTKKEQEHIEKSIKTLS